MKKFIALTEMGVANPEQIAHYTDYMVDNTDILRIIYSRKKGDLLPVSKTFKFPRIKKTVMVDSGTRETNIVYESTATYQNALIELDEILEDNKNKDNLNQILADEVVQLEAEVASRIDYIKSLIEKNK